MDGLPKSAFGVPMTLPCYDREKQSERDVRTSPLIQLDCQLRVRAAEMTVAWHDARLNG